MIGDLKMKKGLVVVYDPHNLYQFIWYFCSQDTGKQWDALCLPNGHKGEYMHTYCEKAQIFDCVYKSNVNYSTMQIVDKIKVFILMSLYFIVGKRKTYCKKLLQQFVDIEKYDELVVIADVGVISGACIALGDEKEIIILEDGQSDYQKRYKTIKKNVLSLYHWEGFLLSLMGYCSPGWFWLDTDKNCIKYCSHPEKMKYKIYKELRQLYELSNTNQTLFFSLIERVYPEIRNISFDNAEAIMFTRPLNDYVNNPEKYERRIEQYINQNYSSIMIKKHPREKREYILSDDVTLQEIPASIPAEALLPYLKGKNIIIISTSSLMLYVKSYDLMCTILNFEDMYEESINDNTPFIPLSISELTSYCEEFAKDHYKIVNLD